jgi:hypothetical protein
MMETPMGSPNKGYDDSIVLSLKNNADTAIEFKSTKDLPEEVCRINADGTVSAYGKPCTDEDFMAALRDFMERQQEGTA